MGRLLVIPDRYPAFLSTFETDVFSSVAGVEVIDVDFNSVAVYTAVRTSGHCPAEDAATWPRTRTVRGNTPAITSATTRTAKPDRNEWVRAA